MLESNRFGKPIEQELGLSFVAPDQELFKDLIKKIEFISNKIGKDFNPPVTPEKGFLSNPMTEGQSKRIDQFLGEKYALDAVVLQDRLATLVTIEESNEKMVFLPKLFDDNKLPLSLSTLPFHEACGEWGGKQRVFWTRETVANKILLAGKALLPLGIIFHLEDGFRPIGVQEGLFLRRVKLTLQQHPEWAQDWDKVWAEARSKTAVSPFMAGHKSGAALDITLRTTDGLPLPLGNKYPEGGPRVAVRFPFVTQEEWSTRQLFNYSMELSGMRIYPYENWHASSGDLSAGIAAFSDTEITANYIGTYGPIRGFDPKTGDIDPYMPNEYFKPFYTKGEFKFTL